MKTQSYKLNFKKNLSTLKLTYLKYFKTLINILFLAILLFFIYDKELLLTLKNNLSLNFLFTLFFLELTKILIIYYINFNLFNTLIKISFKKIVFINSLNSLSNFLITTSGFFLHSIFLKFKFKLNLKDFVYLNFFRLIIGSIVFCFFGFAFSVLQSPKISLFFCIFLILLIYFFFYKIEKIKNKLFYRFSKIRIIIKKIEKKIFIFFLIYYFLSLSFNYFLFINFKITESLYVVAILTSIIYLSVIFMVNFVGFGIGEFLALLYAGISNLNYDNLLLVIFISKIIFVMLNIFIYLISCKQK